MYFAFPFFESSFDDAAPFPLFLCILVHGAGLLYISSATMLISKSKLLFKQNSTLPNFLSHKIHFFPIVTIKISGFVSIG